MQLIEKILPSGIRILVALAALLILICGPVILAVRQPTSVKTPFPSGPRANPDRLRWHVEYLAEELAPRNHNHPEKLAATVRYITTGLSVPGAQVSLQSYTAEKAAPGQEEQVNVIARLVQRKVPL